MLIFSIETSCDETSVAIVKAAGKKNPRFEILANIVSSQIKKHKRFGGVVPNLAARLHLENINFCIGEAFKKAKITPGQIDLIAVTRGPGLIPALLIGTQVAKSLSYIWRKPIIGVNHMEGHIYSNWIPIGVNPKQIQNSKLKISKKRDINFPVLNLIVSGGHTMLVLAKDHFKYEVIGETRDDAVGESFDKVARLLGLPYPGGPIIEKLAKNYKGDLIDFPRPMMHSPDYDFSFSGLKTAVLYTVRKAKKIDKEFQKKISASFAEAALDVLVYKAIKATKEFKVKTLTVSGGVSANKKLSEKIKKALKDNGLAIEFLSPDVAMSTDNAAMVAVTGFFRREAGSIDSWKNLKANANLRFQS